MTGRPRRSIASALTNGFGVQGMMIREIDRIGAVRDGGRRLWGQTEAIRTLLLRGQTARAQTLIDGVFATHLATATPGLWIDSYDAQAARRTPRSPPRPSTT